MLTLAQLQMRQTGITATDIGILAGENPYSSPAIVYESKFKSEDELLEGQSSDDDRTLNGAIFEPALARRYLADMKQPLVIVESPDSYRAPDCEWALATPDRFVFQGPEAETRAKQGDVADWLLECKLVGTRAGANWDLDADTDADRLPPYVYTQVQWQMRVLGYDRCDVAALLYGTTFRRFRVERDDQYIESLQAVADTFWTNYVLKKEPPPPDGTNGYDDFVKREFQKRNRNAASLTDFTPTPEAEGLARTWQMYASIEKNAKIEKKKARQALGMMIAGTSGFKATWGHVRSSERRGRVDWDAFFEGEKIDKSVIDKYRSPSETYLLISVKKNKDEELF